MEEFEQDVLVMIVNRAEHSLSEKERDDLIKHVNQFMRDVSSHVRLAGWAQGKKVASTQVALDVSTGAIATPGRKKPVPSPPVVSDQSLDLSQRAQLASVLNTFAPSASKRAHDSLMASCERYVAGIAARSYLSGWNEGFRTVHTEPGRSAKKRQG